MESDKSKCTVVQDASPQPDSSAEESVSQTMEERPPPFATRQSADDDDSPMVVVPQQTPQQPEQPAGPSDIKSEHDPASDGEEDDGPTISESTSSGSYVSDSEDETGADSSLWCKVSRRNHGELVGWSLYTCPVCSQKLRKPRPPRIPRAAETQVATTAASTDRPTAHRRAQLKYSNKFLWKNSEEIFSQSWPDLLDLDRDRGKLAITQGPTDGPVLEIVTVVATNLEENSRAKRNTNWMISNSSVGIECVGKEIIIHSRRVMDSLQNLITYYPKLELSGLSLRISQPYAPYYHHIDEIKSFQNTYCGLKDGHSETEHPNPASKSANLKICDEETYKHLDIVRGVIEGENLAEVRREIDRHHQSPPVATYSMLWLLFKPGTKVYVRRPGSSVYVGVVLSIQGGDLSVRKSDVFSVDYWTLAFDGFRLGRCLHHFSVKSFAGERRISELEVSPCSYYDAEDAGVLRNALINRGHKYWRFLQGCQVDYQGKLPIDQRDWQGRVMVDPMTYYRYMYHDPDRPYAIRDPALIPPNVGGVSDSESELPQPMRTSAQPMRPPPSQPRVQLMRPPGFGRDRTIPTDQSQNWQTEVPHRNENRAWADYEDIIPGPDTRNLELIDSVTGEKDMSRYLLCPPNVVGFDLRARQWQLFDIAYCHDVAFNHGAIDSLVMKEERKSVIKSLVHRYTAVDSPAGGMQVPKPWTADFIKNKGEGQIFLLHGSPGVGKTYTAECIAEATRRPLLSLTCGDIGTNEVMAERTLSKWFRLAEIWGAVMLLDEADVFLEKRSISDLQRNSLVSVFLRIVEYYRGILFLTTNRVGQFDDAFISRIHTVIHYENFSNDEQDRIWTQFFKKLEKERRKDMRIDRSAWKYVFENKDLRKIEWNGRQIRNAFQTAVAFAEYRFLQLKPEDKEEGEKASLEDQDFAKVCEMTIAFQEYMTSVHGGDESRRARLERIRDDKFKKGSSSS